MEIFSKHLAKKETTLNSLVSVLVDFLILLLSDIGINNDLKKASFKTLVESLGENLDINKLKEGMLIKMSEIVEPAKKIYVDTLLRTLLN